VKDNNGNQVPFVSLDELQAREAQQREYHQRGREIALDGPSQEDN
jgi:hypothetical protein